MPRYRLVELALAAAAGFVLTAGAAAAVDAVAKSAVNVRTGPGLTYGIVDQLYAGEAVDITECAPSNWCFVQHDGPDGWVSATFLTAPNNVPPPPPVDNPSGNNPDCSFGFNIGPSGPSLNVNCGNGPVPPGPPAPPPPPPPISSQACFFTGHNYSGPSFCYGPGTLNALNGAFNDRISSVKLQGGAKARLCVNTSLGGYCRNVFTDTPGLGPLIDDKASSLVVFTGLPPAPPPVVPVTYTTGPLNLPQTFTADLDSGSIGGAGSDIWYQAINPFNKRITPQNGATLAIGDGSGYAGCSAASFSGSPLPLASIPPGTYVCVKTDEGRISQFRVNGFTGTTMKIGYTTWAN
jgi:hypothetical protein